MRSRSTASSTPATGASRSRARSSPTCGAATAPSSRASARTRARPRSVGGREILAEAGLEPRGFVAPAYAYSSALRRVLGRSFDWWAGLSGVHLRGESGIRSLALGLGSSTALKRLTSPALVGAAGRHPGSLMRIDIHPADFERRSHRRAIEALLRRARPRRAVSYDELVPPTGRADAA